MQEDVDYTATSEISMELVFAIAYQGTLETHQIADQNAQLTLNVNKTWLALTKNVRHLVDLEFVVSMLSVMLSITMQFAHVCLDIKEHLILSPAVV